MFNFYEFGSKKIVYGKENYLRFLEQIKDDEKEMGRRVTYSLKETKINERKNSFRIRN